MIESIMTTTGGEPFTVANTLLVLGTAIALGLVISAVYMHTMRKEGFSSGFTITLIMMPAIVAAIVFLIGNNVARAFSLAGAFSLIRFRSSAGAPKDIAYVLYSLGVGLACGIGYLGYAAIFTAVMCLMMVLLHYTKFASAPAGTMLLKITVPENLNYVGLFDDVLDKYSRSWSLRKVRTSDFGTLFEVIFSLSMARGADQKKFIDELRCRNGNLNISLTVKEMED